MGTVFKIYLPCVQDRVAAIEAPDAGSEAVLRGTETLLLVEDEDALRRAAAEFLSLRGYSVLEAKDGLDAMSVAKNHASTIHLAVTDVVMPHISGGQLANELVLLRPETQSAIRFRLRWANRAGPQSGRRRKQLPAEAVHLETTGQ